MAPETLSAVTAATMSTVGTYMDVPMPGPGAGPWYTPPRHEFALDVHDAVKAKAEAKRARRAGRNVRLAKAA